MSDSGQFFVLVLFSVERALLALTIHWQWCWVHWEIMTFTIFTPYVWFLERRNKLRCTNKSGHLQHLWCKTFFPLTFLFDTSLSFIESVDSSSPVHTAAVGAMPYLHPWKKFIVDMVNSLACGRLYKEKYQCFIFSFFFFHKKSLYWVMLEIRSIVSVPLPISVYKTSIFRSCKLYIGLPLLHWVRKKGASCMKKCG